MTPLEQGLTQAAANPQLLAGDLDQADRARLDENLVTIRVELDAGAEPRLSRLLRRIGVPDLTVPLVTATPALRRSWFIAVAVALLFALSATSNQTGTGADKIIVFLTLAPLIPLLGVALAFGSGVDPTHEVVLAAPRDTFTVFLVRTLTVLATSSLALLLASTLLPDGGLFRVAWLLPSIAVTTLTMLLSTGRDPKRIAAMLATGWVVLVVIVSQAASPSAMFGPVTQLAALVAAVVAASVLIGRRDRFESAVVD